MFGSVDSMLKQRSPSADRRENLTHDWKCVHLDNVGPKIVCHPKAKINFGDNWFFGICTQNLRVPSPNRRETLPNDGK